MKKLFLIISILSLFFIACEQGTISTNYPNNDTSNALLSITGSAVPSSGGASISNTVTGNSIFTGSNISMTTQYGTGMLFVGQANDPEGVREFKIWNVGCELYDPTTGIYENPNTGTAPATVTRNVTVIPQPGQKFMIYGTGLNFSSSTSNGISVTDKFEVQASGIQPSLPANTLSRNVTFSFNSGTRLLESFNDPIPNGGSVNIIGVEVINPFNGSFISLYHGPETDRNKLDHYTDFKRLLPNTRVDFFNGPWLNGYWYAFRGNRRGSSSPGTFTAKVYYIISN